MENKNPIIRILSSYDLLDGAYILGNDVRVVCPFHNDTDPSLSISMASGMTGCFGCSWRGTIKDVIKHVSDKNDLEVMMEMEKLKRVKGSLPQIVEKTKNEVPNVSPLAYFKKFTRIDWDASEDMGNGRYIRYFSKRGITVETIKHFKVRVATRSAFPLVFPMMMGKRFIGYQSRRIKEGSPKYIINFGFQRGKTINEWGIEPNKRVLVVEGIIDFLKAWQFGIKNVVSLQGWRVTRTQANIINNLNPKEVVLATDNDHTREKAIDEFERHFRRFSVMDFGDKNDIGEMSEEEFKKCLRKFKKDRKRARV